MAGKNRSPANAVALFQALEQNPYRFGFFQAVRRLECHFVHKPRVGKALRAVDDPIRLTQEPSMAFASSTLASFKAGGEGVPARLVVNFLGLLGPQGPLPLHLTEYARDRLRNADDPTFARFLDLFHHRMLALYYRAWADAQPTVSHDRPEEDRFTVYLGALFGMGMETLRNRDALADNVKLFFSGLLGARTRNADGLRDMLSQFFNLPVRIEQFIGAWMDIPTTHHWRLGESPDTGSLGLTTTLGGRVWGCQHKFRIVVGPLSLNDYQRMLPGGESQKRLIALVRNYVGIELAWDTQLLLKKHEVQPCTLGKTGALGWTSWLGEGAKQRDRDDLILQPRDHHPV